MSRHEELDARNAAVLAIESRRLGCTCIPQADKNFMGEVVVVWWETDLTCRVHRPRTAEQADRIGLGRRRAGSWWRQLGWKWGRA